MDRPTICVLKAVFLEPRGIVPVLSGVSRTDSDGSVMTFFVGDSGYREEVADLIMLNLAWRWSMSEPMVPGTPVFRTMNLMFVPKGGILVLVADAEEERIGFSSDRDAFGCGL